MKKNLLLIALVLFSATCFSQTKWSITGGFGAFGIRNYENMAQTGASARIGVAMEKHIAGHFYFQPNMNLIYASDCLPEQFVGLAVDSKDDNNEADTVDYKTFRHLFYLQMPLYITYRIRLNSHNSLNVKFGPTLGYGISGRYEHKVSKWEMNADNLGELIFDILTFQGTKKEVLLDEKKSLYAKNMFHRFDMGFDFAADYEFSRHWFCGADISLGLLDLSRQRGHGYNDSFGLFMYMGFKF